MRPLRTLAGAFVVLTTASCLGSSSMTFSLGSMGGEFYHDVEVTGSIVEVASKSTTHLAIQGSDKVRKIDSAGTITLKPFVGAEVWIKGAENWRGIRVDDFQVRRVHGEFVDDGIVTISGDSVFLKARNGETRHIPNAPKALRQLSGARIWVAEPKRGVVPGYGVITPR